jgi:hypothetical protein
MIALHPSHGTNSKYRCLISLRNSPTADTESSRLPSVILCGTPCNLQIRALRETLVIGQAGSIKGITQRDTEEARRHTEENFSAEPGVLDSAPGYSGKRGSSETESN